VFEREAKPREKYTGLRIITVCAVGLLLGWGLCGIGNAVPLLRVNGIITFLGSVLVIVCPLGLVLGVLVLIVEAIARARRKDD
jgi:hypothetical protein